MTVLPAPPKERAGTGLRSLELRNVRCFVSVDIPLDAKVTVIIGQNGAGKTTIAEVLASMAHGDDEGLVDGFPLRRGATEGSIALIGDGAERLATWAQPSKGRERSRLSADRLLFAYGRYRRVHFPEAPTRSLGGMALLGPEWRRRWRDHVRRTSRAPRVGPKPRRSCARTTPCSGISATTSLCSTRAAPRTQGSIAPGSDSTPRSRSWMNGSSGSRSSSVTAGPSPS